MFYLKNELNSGSADESFRFGPSNAEGWQPIAGDWNGDGKDGIGLYNDQTGMFYLKNELNSGSADESFRFGSGGGKADGWKPIVGDWNNDGVDGIGLYNPSSGIFYLRYELSSGSANRTFRYGPDESEMLPLIGNWEGIDTSAELTVSGFSVDFGEDFIEFTVTNNGTEETDRFRYLLEVDGQEVDYEFDEDIIVAGGAFTLSEEGFLADLDLDPGEYELTLTVNAENAEPVVRTESFEVPEIETYTVDFTVQDDEDNPLEDVTITITDDNDGEWEITTGADGLAEIDLEDGNYSYTAVLEGYDDETDDFVVAGEDLTIDPITMSEVVETYTVDFTVQDDEDNPLEDVTITITDDNDGEWEIETDADGLADIELEDGEYNYTAVLEGYEEVTGDFEVDGEDLSVDTITMSEVVETYTVTFIEYNGEEDWTVRVYSDEGMENPVGDPVVAEDASQVTKDLEDGDYWFKVELDEYQNYEGDFVVAGEDKDVNFELVEEPDVQEYVIPVGEDGVIDDYPEGEVVFTFDISEAQDSSLLTQATIANFDTDLHSMKFTLPEDVEIDPGDVENLQELMDHSETPDTWGATYSVFMDELLTEYGPNDDGDPIAVILQGVEFAADVVVEIAA